MYLAIHANSMRESHAFAVPAKDIPYDTKVWLAQQAYRVADFYYDYSDDSVSRIAGMRSVDNFYRIMADLFPDLSTRSLIAMKMDADQNHIDFRRIDAGE